MKLAKSQWIFRLEKMPQAGTVFYPSLLLCSMNLRSAITELPDLRNTFQDAQYNSTEPQPPPELNQHLSGTV